jgi:hypothetical protein
MGLERKVAAVRRGHCFGGSTGLRPVARHRSAAARGQGCGRSLSPNGTPRVRSGRNGHGGALRSPTGASGGTYFQPRLSPDGNRLAVTVGGGDHDDVWLYDLARKTWSRFTSEGNNGFPLWTPDGHRLTYVSDKAGPDNIYSKPLDGSRPGERVLVSDRPNYPFHGRATASWPLSWCRPVLSRTFGPCVPISKEDQCRAELGRRTEAAGTDKIAVLLVCDNSTHGATRLRGPKLEHAAEAFTAPNRAMVAATGHRPFRAC